jgi:geranylgeranyl diphosphate synthase type II
LTESRTQPVKTAAAGGDSHVADLLDEYGTLVRSAMTEYLKPREPRRYLYNLVSDYPRRGGRMLRPSLCLAAARAFGAREDDAVKTAVAIELLHNAFLVHDDVEDESDTRRGRPTLNALHGSPIAVNVGDALFFMGLKALLDNTEHLGLSLAMRVLTEAERMLQETVEGQSIELGWRRDNAIHLREADYLQMILKKTCWYTTIFPLRVGALIGSRAELDLDRFVRFGFFAGAAFQIEDDLLNLTGDPVKYGKELNGDILEGKRTLMLIHLLEHASADERQRVADILGRPRQARTAADILWIRERMTTYQSIDYSERMAHGLAGAAQHAFEEAFADVPYSRDRLFLEGIVRWVLSRA